MRNTLFIILFTCMISGCASAELPHEETRQISESIFSSKPVLFTYGAIAGISIAMAFVFLAGGKKSGHSSRHSSGRSEAEKHSERNGYWENQELEGKYFTLEARFKKMEDDNRTLKRQLDEAEQFSKAATPKENFLPPSLPKVPEQPKHQETHASTTVFYLQPATDSRFRETGKVHNAAEALYALTYQNNNPSEATLSFIDTPENTSLAVQNESTWILVACERSNVPTEQTTSIRTDIPGIAILRNKEWEILQKAKITYI